MPIALAELNNGDMRARCDALISTKIQSGFHKELGISEAEYRDSFKDVVDSLTEQKPQQGVLTLVEERIPFVRQVALLGIEMDPGVFYGIAHNQDKKPYGAWLKAVRVQEVPLSGANNYAEAIVGLPADLRPATPFEGINAEVGNILAKTFVTLPGGEYEKAGILTGGSTRFRSLCLDTYFGKARISQVRLNQLDRLVGMLVAHT